MEPGPAAGTLPPTSALTTEERARACVAAERQADAQRRAGRDADVAVEVRGYLVRLVATYTVSERPGIEGERVGPLWRCGITTPAMRAWYDQPDPVLLTCGSGAGGAMAQALDLVERDLSARRRGYVSWEEELAASRRIRTAYQLDSAAEIEEEEEEEEMGWPGRLDQAIRERFGAEVEVETFWNVAAGSLGAYQTNFKTNDPALRSEIFEFVASWMRENVEEEEEEEERGGVAETFEGLLASCEEEHLQAEAEELRAARDRYRKKEQEARGELLRRLGWVLNWSPAEEKIDVEPSGGFIEVAGERIHTGASASYEIVGLRFTVPPNVSSNYYGALFVTMEERRGGTRGIRIGTIRSRADLGAFLLDGRGHWSPQEDEEFEAEEDDRTPALVPELLELCQAALGELRAVQEADGHASSTAALIERLEAGIRRATALTEDEA